MTSKQDITSSASNMTHSQFIEQVLGIPLLEYQRRFIDTIDFNRPHSITLRKVRGKACICFDSQLMQQNKARPHPTNRFTCNTTYSTK